MITNIATQDFSTFAAQVKEDSTRRRLDILADYYSQRVSNNEITLVEQHAKKVVENPAQSTHTPDPRLFMRRDLLGLVQDAYALGTADAIDDIAKMQDPKADFASFLTPEQRLKSDIARLQKEVEQSRKITRQAKTLQQYTKTLQALQKKATVLGNTESLQTLSNIEQELQSLKNDNNVKSGLRLINQQLRRGKVQRKDIQEKIQDDIDNARKIPTEDLATGLDTKVDLTPEVDDYLIKRAIEEKLQYLENRRDSLASTPPIVLDEDKEFFRWYAAKRLIPIANRYQRDIEDRNKEAKEILTKYTEEVNKGTTTQTAKGAITDKVVRRLLNIEEKADKQGRPLKRVQRVVATELAIAYNIGRLKAYMKAGIQYVTISTSLYSPKVCKYCDTTASQTEKEPIKISSILKFNYENRKGNKNRFNKDAKPSIADLRYLPNHPYCYCHYKPHPRRDPEDKVESAGVYGDPNSWRFILGAGLGVSLVFLAFALTSGRKIAAPSKLPTITPPVKVPIPDVASPPSTTVKQLPATIRPAVGLELRFLLEDLADIPLTPKQRSVVKLDLEDILAKNQGDLQAALSDVEDLLSKVKTPEYAKDVLDTIATKRGLEKELYYARYTKLYNQYTKTLSVQPDIDRLANRVESYVNPQTGAAIARAANNIEKSRLDKKLKPLSLLRQDLQKALVATDDLQYKAGLQERITQLDSFIATLENQKLQLDNVRANIFIVNKAVINQRITALQALVDRLENNKDLLEEAVADYEDLLEMLVTLPEKDLAKYVKAQIDLKRRIQKVRGVELKKFIHHIADFTTSPSCKYSVSPRSLLFSIYHRI
ncbi:MAG: hypothetical protein IM613_12880 [Cytophagales bacterium]|nr:hypothetical protein [Cytophagales bacterium]